MEKSIPWLKCYLPTPPQAIVYRASTCQKMLFFLTKPRTGLFVHFLYVPANHIPGRRGVLWRSFAYSRVNPPPSPSKPVLLNPGSPCSPSWRANLVISNVNSFQLALYTNVLKVLEWLVTSENISPCRYARSSSSIGVTFQFIFFFTFQPVFSLHFCPSTLAVKNTFFYQIRGAEKNAWNCCQPP